MANVLLGTANPIYVDATGTLHTGWITIKKILWVNDETAGDDIAAADFFELTDTAGNILVSKCAVVAGDDLHIDFGDDGLPANGLACTSIDGGIAFIYCKPSAI